MKQEKWTKIKNIAIEGAGTLWLNRDYTNHFFYETTFGIMWKANFTKKKTDEKGVHKAFFPWRRVLYIEYLDGII